ncbi:MerR family transcriptional regulator [Amycolatopsis sp. NPDC049159]|uniref:MerR family transcriptional regulator n=1 Tax=Amycolatopsis sp. NPDC049159 TaxID=3157210 RepID=UPI0033CCA878
MTELYPIGDVAHRTGLSVSAIRFYADEGVVAPTACTEGGFRRYDVQAISRLELVRTLRDLGAGLADIRRVLAEETTLPDLARAHLRLVEDRLRQFRARRAVLRTIVRQETTADQVGLLHKLVSLSDDERDRLVAAFWEFVTEGLDVHPAYVEQLEAWIELADLVRDEDFRTSVRDFYHRTFAADRGRLMTTPEMLARFEEHRKLLLEARAARQAGVAADSPRARELAERATDGAADLVAAMTGERGPQESAYATPDGRAARWPAESTGLKLLKKYHTLVATISGAPVPDADPDQAAALREWLAAARR